MTCPPSVKRALAIVDLPSLFVLPGVAAGPKVSVQMSRFKFVGLATGTGRQANGARKGKMISASL